MGNRLEEIERTANEHTIREALKASGTAISPAKILTNDAWEEFYARNTDLVCAKWDETNKVTVRAGTEAIEQVEEPIRLRASRRSFIWATYCFALLSAIFALGLWLGIQHDVVWRLCVAAASAFGIGNVIIGSRRDPLYQRQAVEALQDRQNLREALSPRLLRSGKGKKIVVNIPGEVPTEALCKIRNTGLAVYVCFPWDSVQFMYSSELHGLHGDVAYEQAPKRAPDLMCLVKYRSTVAIITHGRKTNLDSMFIVDAA